MNHSTVKPETKVNGVNLDFKLTSWRVCVGSQDSCGMVIFNLG